MRYLIDGYNLLHALGLLHGRTGPHSLERARRALLGYLSQTRSSQAGEVTIVFDAAHGPLHRAAQQEHQGLHILYTRDCQADDLIEDLIQREATPRQLTIISDDHRVQQAGRRRHCLVLGCLDYVEQMSQPPRPKAEPAEGPAKPQSLSSAETAHWLREFSDLVNDPKVREALGPDFQEAAED
jgi:hypothetical protein